MHMFERKYTSTDCENELMSLNSISIPAGELKVTQAGRDLRTLSSGDMFGELAILYNCKRTASVKGQLSFWSDG